MALKFSARVIGSEAERERLRNMSDRIGGGLGPDGAGPAVLAELADINRERFETSGWGQWPRLSRETVRRRRLAGLSGVFQRGHHYASAPAPGVTAEGPILVWTGALRAAMSDPTRAGSGDALVIMRPESLKLGTRLRYQNFFRGDRDVTELRPEHEKRITEVYERYLDLAAEA